MLGTGKDAPGAFRLTSWGTKFTKDDAGLVLMVRMETFGYMLFLVVVVTQ